MIFISMCVLTPSLMSNVQCTICMLSTLNYVDLKNNKYIHETYKTPKLVQACYAIYDSPDERKMQERKKNNLP